MVVLTLLNKKSKQAIEDVTKTKSKFFNYKQKIKLLITQ